MAPGSDDRVASASCGQPYVRLDRVSKSFGGVPAVDEVSLSIGRGELFALVGGSGCGKTTLLRMLAGFEEPSAGTLLIDGVNMAGVPPYERPVNMMFQSYALFPHMSVEGNVAFGLHQDRIPRADIQRRVAEALDLVQMGALARRRPHQLSGGQKQRVALARSLVKRPKLLLLDEPMAALDKQLRQQTQLELAQIQKQVGITFVLVTHDQEEAMTMADRIAVMHHGRIVQVGTPAEIYEFPNARVVAEFIGSVNLFEGQVIEDEPDHVLIRSDEAGCNLFIGHGISGTVGQQVWVAVRPEKLSLSQEPPARDCNRCRGTVRDVAYLGSLSIYVIDLPTGKRVKATRPNLTRETDPMMRRGDEVWVSWLPAAGVVLTE